MTDYTEPQPLDPGQLEVLSAELLEASDTRAKSVVSINLARKQSGGTSYLALSFTQESGVPVVDTQPGEQFIRIDQDVDITFRLDQADLAWYFDMSHNGLTMKVVPGLDGYKNNYRRGANSNNKPTELTLACQARPNPNPTNPHVEVHPFNLWVKLNQPDGRPDLPVGIDPDIKNPPPPPR
jgi:hypothetical protein